jgi:hypothetical protein
MWHVCPVPDAIEIPLRGPKGEPVDFARTIVSHGVAELPPNRVDLETRVLETTLPVPAGARTVRLSAQDGSLYVDVVAGSAGARVRERLASTVEHMFRLDEDLFRLLRRRPRGRRSVVVRARRRPDAARAPTVFEDVVKTN